MKILRLAFQGFRNLAAGEIIPCGGVNMIHGENGQGKTNLLEAMWLFTGERSFRGARDGEMVALGGAQALLSLDFYSEEREQQAKLSLRNNRRYAELNGVAKRSAGELTGVFCAVIFSPEHLALVKAGPAERRSFLDEALCQVKPTYGALLSKYNRTLTQRNSLLKDIPRHAELQDTLPIWDERLAACGELILRQRQKYTEALSPTAQALYRDISGGREELSLSYSREAEGAPPEEGKLLEALRAAHREDIAVGHTTIGPHRHDLSLFLGGVSARAYASQGQQRSIVLALKLAEATVLEQKTGEAPVIFLDDVMSELDAGRQEYLLGGFSNRQVFMTSCAPQVLQSNAPPAQAMFHVKQGQVSKAEQEG